MLDINVHGLVEALNEFPEKIKRQEETILIYLDTINKLENKLADKEIEVVNTHFDQVDPVSGKKLYSNEDKRNALLAQETAPIQKELDDVKISLKREEIVLRYLSSTQTNTRYVLDFVTATKRSEGK